MRTALFSVIAIAFGYLAIPSILDNASPKRDPDQNKCTAYRDKNRTGPYNIPRPTEKIKIIRLTNSGEFVDRCELTDTFSDLNWDIPAAHNTPLPRTPDAIASLPKLVILYIRGWQHSADKDDDNLKSFEGQIRNIREANREKKNVVGIYIGWNALGGSFPLNYLLFWSKETIADRIAQSSSVTEIVSAIGAILDRKKQFPDEFIAIGHSFGARILFSATEQTLVYESELAHPGHSGGTYKKIKGAADAIILLNPAFDAARFPALDDLSRNAESFSQEQIPILLSVSTDNDYATKFAFPVGQFVGSERSNLELTTIGNYFEYQTHTLTQTDQSKCLSSEDNSLSERFFDSGICLARIVNTSRADGAIPEITPHDPFLVARTTSDIINGHGGIWDKEFSNWLFAFISALIEKRDRSHS